MKRIETSGFFSKLVKLARDESGQIMLMFIIMVPVIMGVIGLSIEANRFYILHSQLQDMADAAALAGAKQLKGQAGARDSARAAAIASAANNPNFWSETVMTARLADSGFFFYSQLNPDLEATSDADASYMKVTTDLGGITPAFMLAVGATNVNQTRATATAANLPVICKVQPLMMCNPLEPIGKDFYEAFTEGIDVKKGMEFHMKVKGNATPGGDGNSWAPGDFGLLDPPNLNSSGANLIRNLLSQQTPEFCYVNNLSPRTGHAVQKVSDGLNVRFDMPVNGSPTGLDISTAPNIIRGLYQNQCTGNPKYNCINTFVGGCPSPLPANATVPLPEDATLTIVGNMFKGNGSLDVAAANLYWQRHYGTDWPLDLLGAGQPNRYRAYLREMGLDLDGSTPPNIISSGQPAPTLVAGAEANTAVCQAPGTNPERRIINVAIIDCLAQNVHGNSPVTLRPTAYAKMFLFRPSWDYATMNANSGDVFGELTDVIPINANSPDIHFVIILVRDHCNSNPPDNMLGCP